MKPHPDFALTPEAPHGSPVFSLIPLPVYSDLVLSNHLKPSSAAQVCEYLWPCLTSGLVCLPLNGATCLLKDKLKTSVHTPLEVPGAFLHKELDGSARILESGPPIVTWLPSSVLLGGVETSLKSPGTANTHCGLSIGLCPNAEHS